MRIYPLALALIVSVAAAAFGGSAGADSLEFLNIGAGARPAAMGEAFVAVADDANAVYWNPAGLAQLRRKELSFMYSQWLEGIDYGSISYAHPLKRGVFGANLSYLSYGKIQGYDNAGVPAAGKLAPTDMSLSAAFSKVLFIKEESRLSAGAALKFIQEDLVMERSNAWALDLGLLYQTPLRPLNIGAVFQNAGIGPKYVKTREPLPTNLRLGGSARFLNETIVLALDYCVPDGYSSFINLGAEYRLSDLLALRAGYQSVNDLGSGLRFGFGLGNKNLIFDYALVPYSELGETHRFGVSLRFGREHEYMEIEKELEKQYRKALSDYQRGKMLEAYRELRDILALAPDYKDAQAYLAKTRVSVNNAELAIQIQQHLRRGVTYFDKGEVTKAQREFETILEFDPNDQEAAAYLAKIKVRFGEVVDSMFNNGLDSYKRAEYDLALEDMKKVLTFNPDHIGAKEHIVLIQEKQKELAEVNKIQTADRLYERGLLASQANEREEAVKRLNETLKLNPQHQKALELLAKVSREIKERDRKEAEEYNTRALRERKEGRLEKAIGLWEKALETDPESANARASLDAARAELGRSNREKAQEYSNEALREYGRGNVKAAVSLWEKALRLDPDSTEAQSNLERARKEIN